jgi:NarL family two-component system response regulator LiaR
MLRVRVALLVEQTLFRKSLGLLLDTDQRFQVVCETREEDAFASMAAARPDVVLIDVDFLGGDPIDTARAIKTGCPDARVCLIALEPRFELQERGANTKMIDGFILKDVGTWELSSALVAIADGQACVSHRTAATQPARAGTTGLLSERELDVVRLIALGMSNKQISSRLFLSRKTIKNHISRIFNKLNVNARTQAAIHAIKHGIA